MHSTPVHERDIMKRYEIVAVTNAESPSDPYPTLLITEDEDGEFVRHDDAMAEIDRLLADRAKCAKDYCALMEVHDGLRNEVARLRLELDASCNAEEQVIKLREDVARLRAESEMLIKEITAIKEYAKDKDQHSKEGYCQTIFDMADDAILPNTPDEKAPAPAKGTP